MLLSFLICSLLLSLAPYVLSLSALIYSVLLSSSRFLQLEAPLCSSISLHPHICPSRSHYSSVTVWQTKLLIFNFCIFLICFSCTQTMIVYIHGCSWSMSYTMLMLYQLLRWPRFPGGLKHTHYIFYFSQIGMQCAENIKGIFWSFLPSHPSGWFCRVIIMSLNREKTQIPHFHAEMKSSPVTHAGLMWKTVVPLPQKMFLGGFVSPLSFSRNFDGSISEMHTARIIHCV